MFITELEYKFRVFIPDLDKMVYFDLNNFDFSDRYLHDKKYPVQQYIGKKDIDGKPIYNGDIVELHTASNDHAKNLEHRRHYGLYEVWWDDFYKLEVIRRNWFFQPGLNDPATTFNIMKVVGNIFETPNLLK